MRSYNLVLAALAGFALSGIIFAAHATGPVGGTQLVATAPN